MDRRRRYFGMDIAATDDQHIEFPGLRSKWKNQPAFHLTKLWHT